MSTNNIRVDKMRYQKNNIAYALVLFSMVFQIISLFSTITPEAVMPSFSTATEILINITLLLVTFLAAEKVKMYSEKWSYGLWVISAAHVFRIFYEPLKLVKLNQLTEGQYTLIITEIIGSIVFMIIASIITLKKYHALMAHLKEMGE